MGLPSSALIEAGAPLASAMPTGAAMGLVQGADGVFRDPSMFTNIFGNPIYKGGEGLLANATSGLLSGLPDYVTPQNLIGAASLVSQQSQQPSFASPGGMRASSFNPNNASSTGIAIRKKEQGYA
jgi:hypothetical protein